MTEARELACQQLVELVTDYLEEALPAPQRARFESHLATCPYCRLYLEQMRQTINTLGHLPPEAIPPHVLEVLLGHFRQWQG